jgi:stage V sporulation protein G
VQTAVLKAYAAEREKSKIPGYVCTYDDYDSEYEAGSYSQLIGEMNGAANRASESQYRSHGPHAGRGAHGNRHRLSHESGHSMASQEAEHGDGFGAGIL